MSNMQKDIASGIMILGGAALLVTGAEAAVPLVAGIGAAASLGAGLYQAISSPRRIRETDDKSSSAPVRRAS
jgi:hypothetical protein